MKKERFNPEMLILAREARGITQSEMAKKLSVSQGNVSKIESGMIRVSDLQLKGDCNAIRLPGKLFLSVIAAARFC